MLHPGNRSPAFRGVDHDGAARSLADYNGQWLLLYFYPKDDTPGCTVEACGFRDRYDNLHGKVAILGVSADSMESHRQFREKYQLPFPLLADPERVIIQQFHATKEELGKRVSFLIDPEGMIRKIYTNIECEGHAGEVVSDVEALH